MQWKNAKEYIPFVPVKSNHFGHQNNAMYALWYGYLDKRSGCVGYIAKLAYSTWTHYESSGPNIMQLHQCEQGALEENTLCKIILTLENVFHS